MDELTEQYFRTKIEEINEKLDEKRQLSREIDRLQEMAVHCDDTDHNSMYIVVGGTPWWERGKKGKGNQKEHNPPHAHILWKYKGKNYPSRFQIEAPNPPKAKDDLKVVNDKDIPLDTIADKLIKWANEKPSHHYSEKTNWEAMRVSWIQIQDDANKGLKNPIILQTLEDYEKETRKSKK